MVRASLIGSVSLLALLFAFTFTVPATAQEVPSGTEIVCEVYEYLVSQGLPIPPGLDAGSCDGGGGGGGGEPPVPGETQCSDLIDNDGDGLIDFIPGNPLGDPDCDNLTDDTESTPVPDPTEDSLALCTDRIDNDEDGSSDLSDTDCASFKPKLTVAKVVVNDNGGTKVVADFPLFVNGSSVVSGAENSFDAGTTTVSETSDASYDPTFSGDCDSSGDIMLAAGDVKTCTITNNDKAAGGDGGGGGYSQSSYYSQASYGGGGGGGGGNGPIADSGAIAPAESAVLGAAAEAVQNAIACDLYLTSFIRPGANNNDVDQVKRLQSVLKNFENAPVEETGVYDDASESAVHALQTKYASDILSPWGITRSTGFVYLTTRKKINEIYCKSAKEFPLSEEEQRLIESARQNTVTVPSAVAEPRDATPVSQETRVNEDVGVRENSEVQTAAAAGATTQTETKQSPTESPLKKIWRPVGDLLSRVLDRLR